MLYSMYSKPSFWEYRDYTVWGSGDSDAFYFILTLYCIPPCTGKSPSLST